MSELVILLQIDADGIEMKKINKILTVLPVIGSTGSFDIASTENRAE